MADAKITDLTESTSPLDTDMLPFVDLTAVADKKVQVGNLVRVVQRIVSSARTIPDGITMLAYRRVSINSGQKISLGSLSVLRIL